MAKKIFALFLSGFLIVALSGCQPDEEVTPTLETDVTQTGEGTSTVEVETESTETAPAESTESTPAESTESTPAESTESSEPEEATVTSVSVVGTDFSFSPSSLNFEAGATVQLTFQNDGGAPHNLVVEGTDIKTATVGSGETTTLTFTAPAAGTYTFYCGVGGHRDAGMVGTLVTR